MPITTSVFPLKRRTKGHHLVHGTANTFGAIAPRGLSILLALLFFFSCKDTSEIKNRTLENKALGLIEKSTWDNGTHRSKMGDGAKLLFSSGFEGVQLAEANEGYQILRGKDRETGFEWPISILGSDFAGIHRINDDDGNAIGNAIVETLGPHGESTRALFQKVAYDVQVTQTPYQINNIKKNPDELYIRYWMKTDTTSLKGTDEWRAIWEYKTKRYAEHGKGFRMIAFMARDINGKTFWSFQGDTSPQRPIWQVENYHLPLIQGTWFQVEYHIKWSAEEDGYAAMKVNGNLVGDHNGPTTFNGQPMDFLMLTQVYGNSHPMHHYIDDIEIWDGVPMQNLENKP